jgi:inhibitor of KinA sporulation pathway (predicted exonuclease)
MRNYIIYDLEATCWEHPPPGFVQEIIEIGAFRINAFGEVRGRFNRFVKPVVHPTLSPFCKDLTSIRQEDVNRARKFPEVIEEFMEWLLQEKHDKYTFLAHNGRGFDFHFILKYRAMLGEHGCHPYQSC